MINNRLLVSVQAERSERDGGDGLVRKRRTAGRVDQKGKHSRRRDSETQNGRQVLRTVQQQRSGSRSAKSSDPGTGVDVQDRKRQVYLSAVQSKYTGEILIFVTLRPKRSAYYPISEYQDRTFFT